MNSPTLIAISVILVLSDSFEESVGTSTRRVILFGTIPTTIPDTTLFVIPPTTHIDTTPIPTVSPTIPPSPDYTLASPDYSAAFDTEFDPYEDPSSDHIPLLPVTLPFLSSIDDSSDTDIPDKLPSPTHVDYSSLDHFSSDDSSRDSSSSSSSETSSDYFADALSDPASSLTALGYISTAGEVQRKYSKSLLLLVVKLLLVVLVATARRVSAVRV
ncbi:hypothetical protein Tco_1243570 [Tanacetum coccineum]